MRVRFAPSPTGALHIGGVRTALYNYLLAKQQGGTFILRIEDTDQTRYVEGAEAYIVEALQWCGLTPDEGPGFGGDYGPYRQSERKDLYGQYAQQLLDAGHAYYAFDTPEELDARREAEKAKGNHGFRYDASTRNSMRNSLSLGADETARLLEEKVPYTVRLRIPSDETIEVQDQIRGTVQFQSNELDDKVILKADGLPTYHLANIVDDHLMEITNVIRGEEWLPSTAHHVLLYRFMGWESEMPQFAHLPLILKPNAKGKLSKRDGAKLGIPVFPLAWDGDTPEDSFTGFREFGFDPAAANNFLAFLGWNPGTEQEIFDMKGLIEAFSIEKVSKGGARFDFDKAKWFNQQYIMAKSDETLAEELKELLGLDKEATWMAAFAGLMKERVQLYPEFQEKGYYFFEDVREYEQKPIRKKWKPERRDSFVQLQERLQAQEPFKATELEALVKQFMADFEYGFGDVLPILRVALSGTTKGPGVFEMIELLGKEVVNQRLEKGYLAFDEILASTKS
ncbi:MAG: glutamate--tRNA ligase [Bacteroidota bacterium]